MIDFITQERLEADTCKLKFPPEIEPENTRFDVLPISTVVNSLNIRVPLFQKAVNIPDLPFEALIALYST